jgi:cystathionine gamma-synthase
LTNRPLSPATRVAQALHFLDEETGAVVPGIIPSSTFARDDDYAPRQSYIYGRDGGPTTKQAEAVLADLDGAAASLLFTSGMSATVAILETLNAGDHIVAPRVMYHGTITWLMRLRDKRGIALDLVDASDPGAIAAALRPGETKLIWIETPTNPNWDVIDIAATAEAAHAAGAKLVVDATVAPPCTMQALALGADFAFHSATKYLGGHSDLTAGVLSSRETGPLWDEIVKVRTLMGSVLPAFESWLLIRGMRTLFLRYERASDNALAIARHFEGHPAIDKVLYPGLPSHPGHEIAARQMTGGFGGMLSILTKTAEQARNVARRTQVFIPATSLGGVESLIEHRAAVEGPNSVVPPTLLRLSVGIEDMGDLIADLEQALA